MLAVRTPSLHLRLLVLLLVTLALVATAHAQDVASPSAASSALKKEFRAQAAYHKGTLLEAYKALVDELDQIEADTESGDYDALAVATRTHAAFTELRALIQSLTIAIADEIAIEASAILTNLESNSSGDLPPTFIAGMGTDVDRGMETLQEQNALFIRKLTRRTASYSRRLDKHGFNVTVRIFGMMPVAIGANGDSAFTTLNYDTMIDVLVGVRKHSTTNDAAIVVGGISDPAKGPFVDVQLNDGVGGIEHVVATPLVDERWLATFPGAAFPLDQGNFRAIATHGKTRVGATIGLR